MKRLFNYFIFIFIFSFLFIYKVNAECSYQERKELLNAAKSVDISYEPVEDSNGSYDFKFNVVGLTDKVFIKYYNLNNGEENFIHYSDTNNGVYSFMDINAYKIYTYNFVFYSANEKCLGYEITTKKIKKPMYNIYSENINCTYEEYKDSKYCQKFLETDLKLTDSKFYDGLNAYFEGNSVKNEDIGNEETFLVKYKIIIIVISILIIITIFIIVLLQVRRKKNKL